MKNKYFILLAVAFGVMLAPHFSFADGITVTPTSTLSGVPANEVIVSVVNTYNGSEDLYLFNSAGNNISGNSQYLLGAGVGPTSTPQSTSWAVLGFPTGLANATYTIAAVYSNSLGEHDGACGLGQTLSNCLANGSSPAPFTTTVSTNPAGTVYPSNIFFAYPTDGTSTVNFDNFQLGATDLPSASDIYTTRITENICSAASTSTGCVPPIYSNSGLNSYSSIQSTGIQVPFVTSFDSQNNDNVNALAQLMDLTTGQTIATDDIDFTLTSIPNSGVSTSTAAQGGITIITKSTGNGTFTTATTTGNQAVVTALLNGVTAYPTNSCPAPTNAVFGFFTGADAYYAGCAMTVLLFVPNQTTNNLMQSDLTSVEAVPPFSWFFTTNNAIMTAANASSSITPDNGVAYTIMTGINGATSSLTILPADLTSNSFLSDGKLLDDYYNFVLTALILVGIIITYKIIL